MNLAIRTFQPGDVDMLAAAFESWPKPRALFVDYARQFTTGSIDMVIAELANEIAGFLIISWSSSYPPFAAARIPEIKDFNVLPYARRQGVGNALMNEAEMRVARRSTIVGLGVGLYSDYGSAQRMYVRRGYIPDGAGVVLNGVSVAAGSMIRLDDDPALMFTKQLR